MTIGLPKVFHDGAWRLYPAKVWTGTKWVAFTPRIMGGIKNIWPRSETPPPPGTHYAWLGEPHGSVSVRLDDDGNETARNRLPNASFEYENLDWLEARQAITLSRTTDSNGALMGDYGLEMQVARGTGFSQQDTWFTVPVRPEDAGKWLAFGMVARLASGGTEFIRLGIRYSFRNGVRLTDAPLKEQTQRTITVQIPEGSDSIEMNIRTSGAATGLLPSAGVVQTDGWSVAVADTEAEALDRVSIEYQAEHYFDGDTPSDRAHDLWYNKQGVPHEWVNGVEGSAGGWVEVR